MKRTQKFCMEKSLIIHSYSKTPLRLLSFDWPNIAPCPKLLIKSKCAEIHTIQASPFDVTLVILHQPQPTTHPCCWTWGSLRFTNSHMVQSVPRLHAQLISRNFVYHTQPMCKANLSTWTVRKWRSYYRLLSHTPLTICLLTPCLTAWTLDRARLPSGSPETPPVRRVVGVVAYWRIRAIAR